MTIEDRIVEAGFRAAVDGYAVQREMEEAYARFTDFGLHPEACEEERATWLARQRLMRIVDPDVFDEVRAAALRAAETALRICRETRLREVS